MSRGLLVAVDGPGGVGKSSVTAEVCRQLAHAGIPSYETTEPSMTTIGRAIRQCTGTYQGYALACLIAGDRHHHVEHEIQPQMGLGAIVVCDRYITSSLVLQHMDGLPQATVWELNQPLLMPDIQVVLTADPEVTSKRLAERGVHSRFEEMSDSSFTERDYYEQAVTFLRGRGVESVTIDCTAAEPVGIARDIVDLIKIRMKHQRSTP
ncbi:dTMP kinase [Streptomyces sp. NPDC051567]|uniref:dTMP kinase n=1 Tax=Streptomyces sp. NPDC051567 TaxID=3365660 RepID=UPI0037949D12